jgi:SAM-dependent methyltransferase
MTAYDESLAGAIVYFDHYFRAVKTSPDGVRVLDFGCGSGRMVKQLRALGYDAHGCDTSIEGLPNCFLRKIGINPYHLPYEDNTFDFIVSTSVLEHAQNKEECFREIHRILRPGGHSVHIYPGKWYLPSEPHIYVPLVSWIWPTVPRWWLALWALLGVRNEFQKGKGWREVTELNAAYCSCGLSYWSTRRYRRISQEIFGNSSFRMESFIELSGGRFNHLVKRFPRSTWSLFAVIGREFRMGVLQQQRRLLSRMHAGGSMQTVSPVVTHLDEVQKNLTKNPQFDIGVIRSNTAARLEEARAFGTQLNQDSKILDVGCGIGDTVDVLCSMGYDAYGIDILEYWGRDFDKLWEDRQRPRGEHLSKLYVVDSAEYRLPFPDGYFDLALSAEVFEHVFNYSEVFREIARVLKPGAISINIFGGGHQLKEGHINVPIPRLCNYKTWLIIWALLGRRSPRQRGLGWRETVAANVEMMKIANYPSMSALHRFARQGGVRIEFASARRLVLKTTGRFPQLTQHWPRFLKYVLATAASIFYLDRYMLIYGRGPARRVSRP